MAERTARLEAQLSSPLLAEAVARLQQQQAKTDAVATKAQQSAANAHERIFHAERRGAAVVCRVHAIGVIGRHRRPPGPAALPQCLH